jgi:hypothetical protein
MAGGLSVLGVEITRNVLGPVRVAGDETGTEFGVGSAGKATSSGFSTAELTVDGELAFWAAILVAAAMFKTGIGLFSAFFVFGGVAAAAAAATTTGAGPVSTC